MQSTTLKRVIILAAITVGYSSALTAEDDVTIFESRYTSEQVGPTENQTELLQTILRIQLPDRIETVGEAIEYVLDPFGYRLSRREPGAAGQYLLLILPLPKPHRTIGPITLIEALSVLGGESFTPVINPVKRNVFFQLKESHKKHVTNADIESAKTIWLEREKNKESAVELSLEGNEQPTLPSYGPVAQGEYLSAIVNHLKVQDVTHNQALVHLFRANPDAFSNGNMNYLFRGVTLTIPSFSNPSIVSAIEASRIVEDQYRIWINQQVTP